MVVLTSLWPSNLGPFGCRIRLPDGEALPQMLPMPRERMAFMSASRRLGAPVLRLCAFALLLSQYPSFEIVLMDVGRCFRSAILRSGSLSRPPAVEQLPSPFRLRVSSVFDLVPGRALSVESLFALGDDALEIYLTNSLKKYDPARFDVIDIEQS